MASIKRLPEAVRSTLRSGTVIYDLTRVVEELIFNSLDAGATKVFVAVNVGTSYVKVMDNGSGITRDGLILLGEKYVTSKYNQDADADLGEYGFRGEALGSISDICLLEIITKAQGLPNGYRKVIKGCKCLYLGISDDRQDVGTTVIVRDLFYNQPVRRKHILSSPKKVLDSVKKCVLRVALVHSNVSFRVVDVESEDQLICTSPSHSSLPLMMSSFGVEASNTLNELSVFDGVLKLSGYISGPSDSCSAKEFQYIYVNSRFICKGPIHKMVNQVAARFYCSDPSNSGSRIRNEKQNRSQICPTFILNLHCPRSSYDLTFEPSKTSVEFKDWGLVLSFVENAVSRLWSENTSTANGNKETKRCRTQSCKSSLDLPSPPKKKHIQDWSRMLACRDRMSPCRNSLENTSGLSHPRTDIELVQPTDFSVQPCHGCDFYGRLADEANESSVKQCPSNILSAEHDFLTNKVLGISRSDEQLGFRLGAEQDAETFYIDGRVPNMPTEVAVLADSYRFDDEIDDSKDLRRSFLQSCSSKRRTSLHGVPLTSDEELEFTINNSRSKRWIDLDGDIDVEIDNRIDGKFGFKTDSSVVKKWVDCCETFDVKVDDSRQNFEHLSKEQFGYSWKCLSPQWSLTSDVTAQARFPDNGHFTNDDVLYGNYVHDKGARYEYLLECEKDDFHFGVDCTLDVSRRETSSFLKCEGTLSSIKNSYTAVNSNRSDGCVREDTLFPSSSQIDTDFQNMFGSSTSGKGIPMDSLVFDRASSLVHINEVPYWKDQMKDQFIITDRKRMSRRCQSAPPLYRCRKKFLSLSNPLMVAAAETNMLDTHDSAYPEANNLGYPRHWPETRDLDLPQPSGQCPAYSALSLADDPFFRQDNDGRKGNAIEFEDNNIEDTVQYTNSHDTDCIEDLREQMLEPAFSGFKWRNGRHQIASGGDSHCNKDQVSILDLSSGILHLAGPSLVPNSIEKKCLKEAKALQQVDKKFIPVVAGRTLAIIDQHAADERIRLEDLRQKVLSGEMKKVTYLDTEQELVMPAMGYQLLDSYAQQVQNWGWICDVYTQDSGSFKKNMKILHKQSTLPKLLAVPCILGVDLSAVDLLEYLQQLADTDGSSAIPPSVHRILNNKACRGAIMFGDSLLPSECSLIVDELKRTSMCFQCAHGRPTIAPLVDLHGLHQQILQLGLANNESYDLSHGLRRHEISIERASQRLRLAGGQVNVSQSIPDGGDWQFNE